MKKNNYNAHRLRSYAIVFGLLILSFGAVFGGLLFRNKLNPDYPLVFTDANNKLMFITKSNNSKNDIAAITDANIVYANNDTRYLLYTNNNSLYLLDTTVEGIGTKIASSISSYGFSKDDKYVYYVDNEKNLFIYDRYKEENIKIASNVSQVEIILGSHIIYSENGKLIYYDLDSKNDDKSVLIANSYETVELNNKLILYSVLSSGYKDYYVYDIDQNEAKKVLNKVAKLYVAENNYTRFLYAIPSETNKDISNALSDTYVSYDKSFTKYTEQDVQNKKITRAAYEENQKEAKLVDFRNQVREYAKNYGKIGYDLYYQNNANKSLVASNITKLYYHDIKTHTYSYTAATFDNNVIDLKAYESLNIEDVKKDIEAAKLESMYYKSGLNGSASMAYKNITDSAQVYLRGNSEYYLLVKDQDYYNLYYSKINNRSLKLVGEIDTNLLTNKLNGNYIDGFLYSNYINNRYYLNMVSEGRVRTLVEDVNPEYIAVSEGKDSIYYLKQTGDNSNDLNIYNGIRTSKVATDVYSFMYINDDLIYVTKNYDAITKTSDLYRLEGSNRLTLIYKDIVDWYSPLKDDEKTEEEETL